MDDEASKKTRNPRQVGKANAEAVERIGGTMGDQEKETKTRGSGRGSAGEGAGQGRRRQGQSGHTVVCDAGTQGAEGEGTKYERQWYNVHADMFRRDNILVGAGHRDQCWRCTKTGGRYHGWSRQ